MTSPIDLLSVFADGVILLGLAATIASSRVSVLGRLAIASVAFASAWLVTAVVDAVGAPAWTLVLGGAVIVMSIVLITATLHLWTQQTDASESGTDCDGGRGGPGQPGPDAPERGGRDGDLRWWPDFERELASYAAAREAEKPVEVIRLASASSA